TLTVESPAWENAVIAGQPNSVAALLYQNFKPVVPGTPAVSIAQKFGNGSVPNGNPALGPTNAAPTLCNQNYPAPYDGSAGPGTGIGDKLQAILGVTPDELSSLGTNAGPGGTPCTNLPAGGAFVGPIG